jgi:hypothetical protein
VRGPVTIDSRDLGAAPVTIYGRACARLWFLAALMRLGKSRNYTAAPASAMARASAQPAWPG